MDILIVYWTGTGNTEALAKHIAEGIAQSGGNPVIKTVSEITPAQAAAYAHILFGCPAMGAEELEETEFEPFFTAAVPLLPGKHIGLFGSYNWGEGEWMHNWKARAEAAGITVNSTLTVQNNETGSEECRRFGKMFVQQ